MAPFFGICGRLYVHELDGQSQLGGVGGLVGAVGGGAFDVDVAEVAVGGHAVSLGVSQQAGVERRELFVGAAEKQAEGRGLVKFADAGALALRRHGDDESAAVGVADKELGAHAAMKIQRVGVGGINVGLAQEGGLLLQIRAAEVAAVGGEGGESDHANLGVGGLPLPHAELGNILIQTVAQIHQALDLILQLAGVAEIGANRRQGKPQLLQVADDADVRQIVGGIVPEALVLPPHGRCEQPQLLIVQQDAAGQTHGLAHLADLEQFLLVLPVFRHGIACLSAEGQGREPLPEVVFLKSGKSLANGRAAGIFRKTAGSRTSVYDLGLSYRIGGGMSRGESRKQGRGGENKKATTLS